MTPGRVLFAFTLFVLAAVRASVSFACQCTYPGTPESELSQSSDVFLGRVTQVLFEPRTAWGHRRIARFERFMSWKGAQTDTLSVETATGWGDCGYPFRTGTVYIVYGWRDSSGVLHTSTCDRTRTVDHASEDLRALGTAPVHLKGYVVRETPATCPVHGIKLRELEDLLILGMPSEMRPSYFAWADEHAPYPGLQIDEASEILSHVLACPQCRETTLNWPGIRGLERGVRASR